MADFMENEVVEAVESVEETGTNEVMAVELDSNGKDDNILAKLGIGAGIVTGATVVGVTVVKKTGLVDKAKDVKDAWQTKKCEKQAEKLRKKGYTVVEPETETKAGDETAETADVVEITKK